MSNWKPMSEAPKDRHILIKTKQGIIESRFSSYADEFVSCYKKDSFFYPDIVRSAVEWMEIPK